MDSDLFRKQYDHEVERQDKIVTSLGLPVGVLTIIGSGAAAMIQGFSYGFSNLNWWFYGLAAVDVVALIAALFFITRAYFSQTYEYLPSDQVRPEARKPLPGTIAPLPSAGLTAPRPTGRAAPTSTRR